MISRDADGRITDFKVMIRPLKAINLVPSNDGKDAAKD